MLDEANKNIKEKTIIEVCFIFDIKLKTKFYMFYKISQNLLSHIIRI